MLPYYMVKVGREEHKEMEGSIGVESEGKGKGEMARQGGSGKERGEGKGREGSIWIFVQGPQIPSYAMHCLYVIAKHLV